MELTIGLRGRPLDKIGMEKDSRTIAVIDDDGGIREALRRMLNIAGFRVQTFECAESFLAALPACEAACAVVDVNLGPGSCGLDLARHPAMSAARLPLIFISGSADESLRERALTLGCIEYLRKPFMPIELLDAVFRATQDPSPIP